MAGRRRQGIKGLNSNVNVGGGGGSTGSRGRLGPVAEATRANPAFRCCGSELPGPCWASHVPLGSACHRAGAWRGQWGCLSGASIFCWAKVKENAPTRVPQHAPHSRVHQGATRQQHGGDGGCQEQYVEPPEARLPSAVESHCKGFTANRQPRCQALQGRHVLQSTNWCEQYPCFSLTRLLMLMF